MGMKKPGKFTPNEWSTPVLIGISVVGAKGAPVKPTPKNSAIDAAMTRLNGISRAEAVKHQMCVTCKGPAVLFRGGKSLREYTISGMCQVCQDDVFGRGEN